MSGDSSQPCRGTTAAQSRLVAQLRVWGPILCVVLLFATNAWGQQLPPPNTAPVGGSGVAAPKPLYFEMFLTVAMCGVALFAVCRNSNRN